MNELISVVVPIYNVENYLSNCIDSILSQTYKNLEIILVDDGSPDNCGKIIDGYAAKDSRIVVIHKQNGGLSDARNAGIDIAKGKYITFVDSDDYISADALQYLYSLIKDNNAQISIGKLRKTSILDDSYTDIHNETFIMNNYDSIREMLYAKYFSTAAPAKLYETDLFEGIRYPYKKFSEDLFTTYLLLEKASLIAYGSKTIYYYYSRPGSITKSGFSKKQLDVIEALDIIEQRIPLDKYQLRKAFASQNIEDIMNMLSRNPMPKEIKALGLWDRIKNYRKCVLFDKKACKRVRGYALLSYLGIHGSIFVLRLYYRRK